MAKYYSEKRPVPKHQSNPFKQGAWLVVAFFSGYFISAAYDVASFKQLVSTKIGTVLNHPPAAVIVKALPPPVPVKPKLEFYTLLTKDTEVETNRADPKPRTAEVVVATPVSSEVPPVSGLMPTPQAKSTVTIAAPATDVTTTHEQYTVQLAAFNNRADAERMKAAFVFKGFHVSVTTTMRDNIQWYRVILGPFLTKGAAETAMQAVARHGRVSGIIRKVPT